MDDITIIGKGKAGSSIAEAIRRSDNRKLASLISARLTRKYPVIQSDVIIIAVKDEAIPAVANKALESALKPPRIMAHLAGSVPYTVLPKRKGVARLTLHPIQTFSEPNGDLLREIFWMASSDSPSALHWARQFVADLGGKGTLTLPPEALPLYHAMMVFGSNFITLLFAAIEEMSEELGLPIKRTKAAVRPLAEHALRIALTNQAREVLTGPIQRNDTATIEKHQKALKALDPKLRAIYDAFLEQALRQ